MFKNIGKPQGFLRYIILPIFLLALMPAAYSQSCNSSFFSKSYTFQGFGYGYFFDRLPGGEMYFGGVKRYTTVIHKTDTAGTPLWTKQYKFQNSIMYSTYGLASVDSNKNYFISIDANCIGMLDDKGNVLDGREIKIPGSNVIGTSLGVLPDNKKVLFVDDQSTYGGEGFMLMCLSPDLSTILWTKHFSGWQAYFKNLAVLDNKIFVTGSYNDIGTLLSFDFNGNLLSKNNYHVGNAQTVLQKIYAYDNGYIVQGVYFPGELLSHIILRLDKNLNLLNSYSLASVWENASLAITVDPDGSMFGAWGTFGFGHYRYFINNKDKVVWNRLNSAAGLAPQVIHNTPEGLSLLGSSNWNDVASQTSLSALNISRSDINGIFHGCLNVDYPLVLEKQKTIQGISAVQVRDTSLAVLGPATIIATDDNDIITESCKFTNTCDSIRIIGSNSFCNVDSGTFIARRSIGCYTPVQWTLSGKDFIKSTVNDSMLSLKFLRPGSYKLVARLGDCKSVADSISITVTLSGQVFSLGPDKSICPGTSLLLHAGTSYVSYRWQDGYSDSTFLVAQAGSYNVEVTDGCGIRYRDTVVITAAQPIFLNAGPDRTTCDNDTVHLDAPAGFTSYSWTPAYNISDVNAQHVIVNPLTDTTYILKAGSISGCFSYDTIHIVVNHSSPASLGADTSFCEGGRVTFSPGTGYISYLWNNNATSASITVTSPGTYSVDAQNANGCHSYDTVKVLNVFSNPRPWLNHDSRICYGEVRILDPGNFTSYLWSDGSSGRTLKVNNTGTFTVMVSDANRCKGYDTATVNTILPAPSNFLPGDTSVCSYTSLLLSASSAYPRYLWSNSSTTASISIQQPGTYWLQVTDLQNCSGTDSITIVQRDCMEGVYVPTAFTPNQDGRNDTFHPLLFGKVSSYTFTVYNRFGEMIYQAKDPSKGWDGTYKGMKQNTNVYSWTCAYQFEGEKPAFKKGTVTLIN